MSAIPDLAEINVVVKPLSPVTTTSSVSPAAPSGLQRQQHRDLNLPTDYFDNQDVMEDDYSFPWHNVRPGDTIEIFNGSVTGVAPPAATTVRGATANSKKLRLMVLPEGGTKKIAVEVNPSDNVGELTKKLKKELQKLQHQHRNLNLPTDYIFMYKQNVMEDDQSFRWHNVRSGDTIEIFYVN